VALEDELIAIRLELQGQTEAVAGMKEVIDAEKGLGTQTRATGEESKAAEKHTLGLGNAYGTLYGKAKLALGFLGVGGVFAVEQAVHNTEELSKTTTGLSRNLGLATNVASRWGAVAFSREIDPKALGMSFGVLSSKMVEAARKGSTLLTPFHQLGLNQEEVAKGAGNFEWGLMRVVKALGEEEGGAKRATAAKAVLGKGYATLLPLFAEGTEGLKEQLHWADEYGVTLGGKANEGLMELVKGQREMKVATLGLQVSLTKALQPAILAGEEQVKEFIKTLNDPNLSAEQKTKRIEHQFLELEDDLMKIIEQALPGVAENAGRLGVKMAAAVWHGFQHSNLLGKIAIAGWVFSLFGGEALVKTGAKKVGGMIGTDMGIGIGVGVTGGFIAGEIFNHLSRQTQQEVSGWAYHAAHNFVNFFVAEVNKGLNDANVLSFLGVEAPQVPEWKDHLREAEEERPLGKGTSSHVLGTGGGGSNAAKRKAYESLWGKAPPAGPPPWPPPRKGPPLAPRLNAPSLPSGLGAAWHGRPAGSLVVHTHLHLDGRELTESVARHVLDAEALS
jgi:hypothetical protein